ncbi:MAG TPA: chemotaxis protein, partial [Alteromonas macleodii]|nr:chemotaxis protein [Alteromonas macleodii]
MVAIAANYLDNFFSNKSNAFIIAFLMMLASWSLAFTSIAHLGL